ncbi:KilA-N domain-containing protein [Providencia sp. PROV064]|uniref:KilA-N domain-containing protein n=1 Tax=Providencia sp. PROV064 TaxID=2949790 RepID=UPI003FA7B963
MTNQLIISNTSIHQDSIGRYSLNDLHKASGGQKRHQPSDWLRLEQTNELIAEILKPEITGIKNTNNLKVENPTFEPVSSKKGRYGGTYVCKELVYSYAMWISAAFALKVIRAYDDLVNGRIEQAIRRSTVQERNPLKDAVNLLVSKKGIMYPEAYAFVHQRFNISSIEELTTNQIPEAVEYIHKIVLEGEYIPRQQPPQVSIESLAMPISFFDDFDWLFEEENISKKEALSHADAYPRCMLKTAPEYPNPVGVLLNKLQSAGVDVSAAQIQLRALRNHLRAAIMQLEMANRSDLKMLLNNTNVVYKHLKAIREEWRNTLSPAIEKLNPELESHITSRLADAQGATYSNLCHLQKHDSTKAIK